MSGSRSAYTRMRILEAATQLIAIKGDKTSLREITAQAQVNVSAVNYHFGSKEGLISAVYQHQVETLKQAQVEFLDQLEAEAAGSGPIPPNKLVEAYFRPIIENTVNPYWPAHGRDPSTMLRNLFRKEHVAIMERYKHAFTKSLPQMPEAELVWRLLFMFTAVSCALSGADSLSRELMSPDRVPLTAEELSDRLIPFLIGGLLAPLSRKTGESRSHDDDTDKLTEVST